jgi:DNA polymerase/3'-5' exonuclease PolX
MSEAVFSNGTTGAISNAEIADRLASLAQLMAAGKENPYKVKAYQRAAARIRTFPASIDEMVREDGDITTFPGIGDSIAACIREIVTTGRLASSTSCAQAPALSLPASANIRGSILSASYGSTKTRDWID